MTRLLPLLALLTGCPPPEGPLLDWSASLQEDERGLFLSAWGASSEAVWVVGGQPDAGVVLRGSEDDWSEVPLPEGTPLLNWVHGSSATDVWVGGISGTLLRWDGSAWEDWSVQTDAALWGVYARSTSEAWAVGGASSWGGDTAVAFAFDGDAWAPMTLPEGADVSSLFKVAHDGEALWMVGADGLALTTDGASPLAKAPTGFADDLVTVNAAAGPLVVVGGRGTGSVLERGGDGLARTAQARAGLEGVHVFAEDAALVTGENGLTGIYDPSTDTLEEVPPTTTAVLHGCFVAPDGTFYAVGGNLFTSSTTFEGALLVAPPFQD